MTYILQTFSFEQVLTSAQMNQVEVNIRDHVHGRDSVVSTGINFPRETKADGFTAQVSDNGKFFECSGTFTITFDSAATLTSGWAITVSNTDAGDITIDPNGAETIDGVTTFALPSGSEVVIYSDGTNLQFLLGNIITGVARGNTESLSGTIGTGAGANITMNGAAFFPMIHADVATFVQGSLVDGADPDAPRFRFQNDTGGNSNYDVDYRYIVGP